MASAVNPLADAFARFHDRTCLIDGITGRRLTCSEFLAMARAVLASLRGAGAQKGDTIVCVAENRIELLVLYMAILLGGMRAVPIDPLKGKMEIAAILKQIEPAVFVTDEPTRFSSVNARVLDIASLPQNGEAQESMGDIESLNTDEVFLVTFTSGTTGTPKGVMHSFGNLAKSAEVFSSRFNFGPDNVFYHNLPMTYMAGILNQFIQPLLAGATLVVGPRFSVSNISSFWRVPSAHDVNLFWFNPSMLALLLKLDRGTEGIEFARNIQIIGCVGTAPLSMRIKHEFSERYGIALYESYGSSETLFIATEWPDASEAGSVGKPLDGISLRFADDTELCVKADWMFKGYVGRIDGLDAEGYFPSGDLGKLDEQGRLFITGRKKDLIIRGGINISPSTVETVLVAHPEFEEVAVVGLPDETRGEKTVCFYVKHASFKESACQRANADVVAKLGSAYRIDRFIAMDALPRNINGKIDTNALRNYDHRA